MPSRKIAISISESVLDRIDDLARKSQKSRSGYITDILEKVARTSREAEITARINDLFSDPGVQKEQKEVSDFFLSGNAFEGEEW